MPNRLTEILANKRLEIEALDRQVLRREAAAAPAARDFLAALLRSRSAGRPALIAELKRASPSKGMLAPHLDLDEVAEIYINNGAAAISVLTDAKFFLGKSETLSHLRFTRSINVPLLRKDFILDPAQVYESRVIGADALLLIAAALPDDGELADLHALALSLGMTALVEVHTQAELERVLRLAGLRLLGINNRDLATFQVSLSTCESLRRLVPPEICVVAESGIFTGADVARLAKAGLDAILVGEALVTAPDIAAKVRELSGRE